MLPKEFWVPNEMGVRGGIEYGFSSTTTDKGQALECEQQPVDRSVPLRPRRNPPLSASSCPSSMLTALGANGSISLSLPPSLPLSTVCVQTPPGAWGPALTLTRR